MKKILLVFVSLVLFYTSMQAQWNQYLTKQTTLIDQVSVVNDNVVWITDTAIAHFSITTDGGISWITKSFPASLIGSSVGGLTAVSATTSFFVVSQGPDMGIYKTTNSGDTWVKQTSGFNPTISFPDCIYFWNENEGVAIGDGNLNLTLEVYTTSNGGTDWTPVPASAFPTTVNDFTYNTNSVLRVHGNTIYIFTGSGKIMKSINKGLNWTVINTPFTNGNYMSFDFMDDNTGLITNYNPTTYYYDLYSTSDGGQQWTKGTLINVYSNLKYIPSEKAWFSMNTSLGFSYSLDNGLTWTMHPSFRNTGIKTAEITPSGKIFMGGRQFMYYSTNFKGINPSLQQVVVNNSTHIDLYFDSPMETASAQSLENYSIIYTMKPDTSTHNYTYFIPVLTASQDMNNKSLVRLVTFNSVPKDTVTFYVNNVKDLNGFPVINGSTGALSTKIFTSTRQVYGSTIQIVLNKAGNELTVSGVQGNAVFNLYDLKGHIILSRNLSGNTSVPVGPLPSGVYMVKLTTAEGTVERKILKN